MTSLYTSAESRVLGVQALLVTISSLAGFFVDGISSAIALACGGAIALLNTWLLRRSVCRAFANAQVSTTGGALSLFSGLVTRLAAMAALFGGGFVFLKLEPVPFIIGFAAAQTAYAFGSISGMRHAEKN